MRCRESRAVGRGLHAQFGQVGRIALTDEFSYVQFARAGRAAFAAQLVLAGGLVAQRHVEVADAAIVGRGNGEPREVGAYARDVLAACDAVAEPSGVLVDQQLARHPVGIVFGIGDAPQLREVPVGAPDRIGIVIVVFRPASAVERNLPDRAVVGGVGPVHVAGQAAPQQGVEQPRVELHAVIVQAALDAKPAQRLFPRVVRLAAHPVEIFPGGLLFEVQPRVLHRRVRQADLQPHLLTLAGVETQVEPCSDACAAALPREGLLAAERAPGRRLGVEYGAEIHCHRGAFLVNVDIGGLGHHPALDTSVVGVGHRRVAHRAAFAHARPDVEDQVRLLRRREGIAVESDPFGGCQLGLDAVILQQHGVVAGARHLVLLVEARTVARVGVVERPGYGLKFADRRSHHHAADLELVEVGEALDRGVA